MWQSLLFKNHYRYYPDVDFIPNCQFENILLPHFYIKLS